jgi:hypothetical protein
MRMRIGQRPALEITWIRDDRAVDEARYRVRVFGKDARVFDLRISLTAKAQARRRLKRRSRSGSNTTIWQSQVRLREFPITTSLRNEPLPTARTEGAFSDVVRFRDDVGGHQRAAKLLSRGDAGLAEQIFKRHSLRKLPLFCRGDW